MPCLVARQFIALLSTVALLVTNTMQQSFFPCLTALFGIMYNSLALSTSVISCLAYLVDDFSSSLSYSKFK